MDRIKFEIREYIAVLGGDGDWTMELNKVSWNGAEPKYDIRKWNEDHTKMTRGITLTESEYEKLAAVFQGTEVQR